MLTIQNPLHNQIMSSATSLIETSFEGAGKLKSAAEIRTPNFVGNFHKFEFVGQTRSEEGALFLSSLIFHSADLKTSDDIMEEKSAEHRITAEIVRKSLASEFDVPEEDVKVNRFDVTGAKYFCAENKQV